MKRTSIISNSLIYFHKYYIYSLYTKKNLKEELIPLFNKEEIACISMACFFLPLKVSNFLFHIDFIINTFCAFENISSEEKKNKIKQKVLSYEFDILISINFSFENELPHNFLKNVMELISPEILKTLNKDKNDFLLNNDLNIENSNENKIKIIKGKILEIANISFLFPFFLRYKSEVIALSCVKLALNQLNINLNIKDINNIIIKNQKETKVSIDIIDINDIEICSSLISDFVLSKIKINSNNIKNKLNSEKNAETKAKIELNDKNKNFNDKTFLTKKRKTFHE